MADFVRIIVCGSRDYPNVLLVGAVIDCLVETCHRMAKSLVLVHGDCPTGADAIADACASRAISRGEAVLIERHPAPFKTLGPSTGPRRNREMAARGASACIAFWDGASRGTASMMAEATIAKIPVLVPTSAAVARALCRALVGT